MALSPGTKLGPYEIVAPLGAGGMGEVYRAKDTRLGRDVAVKILPADIGKDALRKQRFEFSAQCGALLHPEFCQAAGNRLNFLHDDLRRITSRNQSRS